MASAAARSFNLERRVYEGHRVVRERRVAGSESAADALAEPLRGLDRIAVAVARDDPESRVAACRAIDVSVRRRPFWPSGWPVVGST